MLFSYTILSYAILSYTILLTICHSNIMFIKNIFIQSRLILIFNQPSLTTLPKPPFSTRNIHLITLIPTLIPIINFIIILHI